MSRGQAAQLLRERDLTSVVEPFLVPEEHHLVLQHGVPDSLHRFGVEVGAQPDAGDFRADLACDLANISFEVPVRHVLPPPDHRFFRQRAACAVEMQRGSGK